VDGRRAANASSPANAVINIDVPMVPDIGAPFIALALANRRPIAGVWKRHGKRCQALLPKQPSRALCTTLKTLRYFRQKNEHARPSFSLADGYVQSRWTPCWPRSPYKPKRAQAPDLPLGAAELIASIPADLSIPDFLKRAPVAISESLEGILVDALRADRWHNGAAL
jgi:hypothetical protein